MKLFKFIINRIFSSSITLFGLSILIFCMARLIPGDPARMALGDRASLEQVEAMREKLLLNEPIYIQYFSYLKGVFRGDLGYSIFTKKPVTQNIYDFLPATLELILFAGLFMIAIGVPLGAIAAKNNGRLGDFIIRFFAIFNIVTPAFVIGILLMILFSHNLGWLPIAGRISDPIFTPVRITGLYTLDSLIMLDFKNFMDSLRHILLPSIALSLAGLSQAIRLTRANMLDTLKAPYTEMANAFAFSDKSILFKYALKPALIPTITIIGLDFSAMLGNAFLVEMVFDWPGIAKYGVHSTMNADLNAIVGVVLIIGLMFLVVNILIDILIALINPKVRLG
jgi:peptide/nickel transport system permease protein